jgi:hypothetical protein
MLPNVQIKGSTGMIHQINCMVYGIVQRQALILGTDGNSFQESRLGVVKSCNRRAK